MDGGTQSSAQLKYLSGQKLEHASHSKSSRLVLELLSDSLLLIIPASASAILQVQGTIEKVIF